SYDKAEESLKAEGNVEVTQGNTLIKSDALNYNKASGSMTATGPVSISVNKDLITGDRLDYNSNSKALTISNSKIFIKEGNYHISGKKLTKEGENKYSIAEGSFTTCDGPSPSWLIRASKVDVEIGEYLFAKHARFHIKKLPVLYLPWLAAPVKTERQSGLLAPEFGYSDVEGFIYNQPFFWAISRNSDATFTLNHKSKLATGGKLDYRYIRRRGSDGELNLEYMDERSPQRKKRWLWSQRHKEQLSPTLYTTFDLNFISDSDFLLDYAEDSDISSRQFLRSKATVVKNWVNYSLITGFIYRKNLHIKEESTLQNLPEVILSGKSSKIGNTPLHFKLESRFDNFWRETSDESSGLYSGQRLDIHPTLLLPFSPGNIFELTTKLGLRETVYYTDRDEERQQTREIYDFEVDFSIPLSRVYGVNLEDEDRLRHTVEPQLTYSFIPEVNQAKLPSYDAIDNIVKRNSIRFALNNYIVTKKVEDENAKYNRLIDLSIYSDYDLNEAERELSQPEDERRPWGDLITQLKIKGEENFTINSELRYDTYLSQTKYISADLSTKTANDNKFKLSYRYDLNSDLTYMDSSFRYKTFSFMDVAYRGKYSITERDFLENSYGVMLTRQCWSITISYLEKKAPREHRIYALINLKGLGPLGRGSGLFSN
ncbi:MAG: LPS assembly protein LptD, partial [bacterium]|nr:LPS assembly protein LptD [bacterium]